MYNDNDGVHFSHCFQGEYEDTCKYCDPSCPATPKVEKPIQFDRKKFNVSAKDAKRVVDALEFDASCDKTEIYYELKNWLDGEIVCKIV